MADPLLTNEQMQAIRDALKTKIPELKAALAQAKAAKLDVALMEQRLTEMETQLQALHDVYVAPKTARRT